MKDRYWKRRNFAVEYLGGECGKCGSLDSLEVDHIDRKKKKLTFEKMTMVSWDKFFTELKKCQLLCREHHEEKSIKDLGFKVAKGEHGTLSTYRYCKCDKCRGAKSRWTKEYRLKKKLS